MFATLLFPTPLTDHMNHVTHSITHDLLRSIIPELVFGLDAARRLTLDHGCQKRDYERGTRR